MQQVTNYDSYIIDPNNQLQGVRAGGRGNAMQILTYQDGTEWVYLANKQSQRFCGFLYLQDALKREGFDNILPAENKMALNGRQIIYLSRYCGEQRVEDFSKARTVFANLQKIGFTDNFGGCNLREIGEKYYVFDTEPASFTGVSSQINAFMPMHDAIRKVLEDKIKD